jgi:hypothetical protein
LSCFLATCTAFQKDLQVRSDQQGQRKLRKLLPCSAVGSREALGSSNKSRPTSDSDVTVRIKVLALVENLVYTIHTIICKAPTQQAAASDLH